MKKIAFQQKKCQVLKNFRIDFLSSKKIPKTWIFFLLERDLFHEIDQIFGQDVGISGWNVMFTPQFENFRGWKATEKFCFRTQKFVKIPKMAYLKNGLRSAVAIYMAEIRPLLGLGGWT